MKYELNLGKIAYTGTRKINSVDLNDSLSSIESAFDNLESCKE